MGPTSYRRAASNPQFVNGAYRRAYGATSNRGSLAYLSFLAHFRARVNKVIEAALPYENRPPWISPSPESVHNLRKNIMLEFLNSMVTYQILNPELNIVPLPNTETLEDVFERFWHLRCPRARSRPDPLYRTGLVRGPPTRNQRAGW